MTLNSRPRISSVAGMEIGVPVAMTSIPRLKPVGGVHSNRTDGIFPDILLAFQHDHFAVIVGHLEGIINIRQIGFVFESHVHHRPDDLGNFSGGFLFSMGFPENLAQRYRKIRE